MRGVATHAARSSCASVTSSATTRIYAQYEVAKLDCARAFSIASLANVQPAPFAQSFVIPRSPGGDVFALGVLDSTSDEDPMTNPPTHLAATLHRPSGIVARLCANCQLTQLACA